MVPQHAGADENLLARGKRRLHLKDVPVEWEINHEHVFFDPLICCQKGRDSAGKLRVHMAS